MIQILLIVHIFIGVLLVGVILFQKSEGGGLGSSQQASLFSSRGVDHFFTRITITLAVLFAINCLIMGILLGKKESLFKNAPVKTHQEFNIPAPPEKTDLPSSTTTPKQETAK